MKILKCVLLTSAVIALSGNAKADSMTFVFNCQITAATTPDSCNPGGPYGTITIADSLIDPNRVDINFAATAQPGYGDTLEQFYLNFANPFLTNHKFYLVRQDAIAGVASNSPYGGQFPSDPAGYQLGSVTYANSNVSFGDFKFDVNPDPNNGSLIFAGSLSLYNQLPAIDTPVNLNAADFFSTTSGTGTPPLYAAYRTHNTASGPEFWAGSTTTVNQVPEPSSLLLLGTVLTGLGVAIRRSRLSSAK